MAAGMKRRWFQFSLRTLLIAMTALALWLGLYVKSFRDRRLAIAAVQELNGSLSLRPTEPTWLQSFVSDEKFFWNPVAVRFNENYPIGDDELRSTIPHLLTFDELYYLNLYKSRVTDAGLAHILRLADRLQVLDVRNTAISDKAVAYIQQLPKLRLLRLSGSRITTEGVNEIRKSLPNCKFDDQ